MSKARKSLVVGCASFAILASGIVLSSSASAAPVVVNEAPIRTLTGLGTLLATPTSLARDSGGYLYVGNGGGSYVSIYRPTASGNASPLTHFNTLSPMSTVGVAPDGTLAVTLQGSAGAGAVTIYSPGSTTPTRIIGGASTGLDGAYGVVITRTGVVYVANGGNNSITVYGPNAHGDATPIRTIQGSATRLNYPTGIALRPDGQLVVASGGNGRVLTFAANANGNVTPIRTVTGTSTGIESPISVSLDSANRIYQTSPGLNRVQVFAATANGNVAPLVRLTGARAALLNPYSTYVGPGGQLTVANAGNNRVSTYAPLFNRTQVPLNSCVVAPAVIRRSAYTQLMKPNCRTNAGRAVQFRFTGNQNQGGVPRFRIVRTGGSVFVRTFTAPFSLRATWSAPATVTYKAYSKTKAYSR